jgi:hypothetical protein
LYSLAATAAGVGALAMASSAEAKIVYTPTKVRIGLVPVQIDLNHDGLTDFVLAQYGSATTYRYFNKLYEYSPDSQASNQVFGTANGWAKAFPPGVKIEPNNRKFGTGGLAGSARLKHGGSTTFKGPWANSGKGLKDHYLGFKFYVNGKAHFGWARLSVKPKSISATLTGYAYETVPNKAIATGDTKGPDTVHPGTLGSLAQGRR